MQVSAEEAVRYPKVCLFLTMMIPVSLLAIMMEMRQVFGRTAAMMSSTSTRAVTLDTGTNVTSVRDKSRNIWRLVSNNIFFFIYYSSKRLYRMVSYLPGHLSVGARLLGWRRHVPHWRWWCEEGLCFYSAAHHLALEPCSFSWSTLQQCGAPGYWPERRFVLHEPPLHAWNNYSADVAE